MVTGIHHVALRCNDARETIEFYRDTLGASLTAAVSGDTVPSTGEFSPHINLFLRLSDGSMLDFVEVPLSPAAQKDPNTPSWVQHLALVADSEEELLATKQRLQSRGIAVVGPADHGFCKSIYFFDPSGHRIELAWNHNLQALDQLSLRAQQTYEQWLVQKARGW
ncbi:MAG TPA: VOC family protein [Steroidobacter sp.]|uniref:VOC family protein n=1 Tax=Steroidobacter sp. TaxID=1978227 RepID=UPI002EDB52D1